MYDILQDLPSQHRSIALQHEGLVKARRLARRYQQMVAQLTKAAVLKSTPAVLPVTVSASRGVPIRNRRIA